MLNVYNLEIQLISPNLKRKKTFNIEKLEFQRISFNLMKKKIMNIDAKLGGRYLSLQIVNKIQ